MRKILKKIWHTYFEGYMKLYGPMIRANAIPVI